MPTPNEARTSAKTLPANALYFPIWPGDHKYSLNGLTNINWRRRDAVFILSLSLSAYYVELLRVLSFCLFPRADIDPFVAYFA